MKSKIDTDKNKKNINLVSIDSTIEKDIDKIIKKEFSLKELIKIKVPR